jgi:hypothetical protein
VRLSALAVELEKPFRVSHLQGFGISDSKNFIGESISLVGLVRRTIFPLARVGGLGRFLEAGRNYLLLAACWSLEGRVSLVVHFPCLLDAFLGVGAHSLYVGRIPEQPD